MRRAVIDVGSNSVLLAVGERTGAGWLPVFEDTAVTALGEGTKETGLLSEVAMARTLDALQGMFTRARELDAKEIWAGVTMAGRIARNTHELLNRAQAQKTPVFVLSGESEAELGFQSVASDPRFRDADRLSIVDPGGQSTELVTADRVGNGWSIRFRRSYPIGTLALRGTSLASESPGSLELLRACAELDDEIGLCYRPSQCGRVVVLGATGTNLISIRERMLTWQPDRVHGATLDYEEVSRAVGWLSGLTDAERAAVPGMEPGRERTIHLGAIILERFMFALRAPACQVSVRGWRHALMEQDPHYVSLLGRQ